MFYPFCAMQGIRWIITSIVIVVFGWISVYAQSSSCGTCGAPPQTFSDYEKFMRSIITSVQTLWWDGAWLGRYTVPGLFQSQVLDFPEVERDFVERGVDAIIRNANQRLQWTLATTYTLLSDGIDLVSYDWFLWFTLLFQNQAIVRDWASLQALDALIQEQTYSLGVAAAWLQRISDQDRNQIQAAIQSAIDSNLIVSMSIDSRTTYADLFSTLKLVNNHMKGFMSVGWTKPFSLQIPAPIKGSTHRVRIVFNYERIAQMDIDYMCARFGDTCAGNFKQFAENIKKVGKNNAVQSKQAVQTMKNAFNNLKNALKNTFSKKWLQSQKQNLDRQKELLRSVYGSEFKKFGDLFDDFPIPKKKDTLGTNTSSNALQSRSARAVRGAQNDKKAVSSGVDQAAVLQAIAQAQIRLQSSSLQQSLDKSVQSVLHAHDFYKQYAWEEMLDATIYVPQIAYQLQLIRDLVWTKDSQGMLLYNLGKACELQCQNKWWTCWY